jgi:prepilin-type N-terminal cleavage/methylation domain-containing protein
MNEHSTPRGNGFSLAELVMAILVIAVGLLALATVSGYTIGQVQLSRLRTERAAAVQQAMEVVRSQPFADIAHGSGTFGRYAVTWSAQPVNYALTRVELISVGPSWTPSGVAHNVADTLRISVTRP